MNMFWYVAWPLIVSIKAFHMKWEMIKKRAFWILRICCGWLNIWFKKRYNLLVNFVENKWNSNKLPTNTSYRRNNLNGKVILVGESYHKRQIRQTRWMQILLGWRWKLYFSWLEESYETIKLKKDAEHGGAKKWRLHQRWKKSYLESVLTKRTKPSTRMLKLR